MNTQFSNCKELNKSLIELTNKYASHELKSNNRYFDVLTNICSVIENTYLVWQNFPKRSVEYKQTILNEKLTLEFLQIYNRTRDELNCYQTFSQQLRSSDTGLIFYGFFHHILSVYPNNKEIIAEIYKIIPARYWVNYRNNKSRNFSILDFISDDLKNDCNFIESIINPIFEKDNEFVFCFLNIKTLIDYTNLKSNFEFLYKINKKLEVLQKNTNYTLSIKPSSIEEIELFKEYTKRKSLFDDLSINIQDTATASKKKIKI